VFNSLVRRALAATAALLGLGLILFFAANRPLLEMCGEPLEVVAGLRLVDSGDHYGEVVGVSRRILPTHREPVPTGIEEVLRPPAGFVREPGDPESREGDADLGSLRSADGSCRIHVRVLTGDAMEPGLQEDPSVVWYALVIEGV
jgi:hypothetical protein